jgi:hypothetical protein
MTNFTSAIFIHYGRGRTKERGEGSEVFFASLCPKHPSQKKRACGFFRATSPQTHALSPHTRHAASPPTRSGEQERSGERPSRSPPPPASLASGARSGAVHPPLLTHPP